jgi:succinate dehydrogenase / fumarate reductase membrane anchor subunit
MAARSIGRRLKPSGGYELFMWYFMRLSGLALVFLAVGHLFIMHILNNVETINYAFVASRWTAPRTGWIWRLWDISLISLAVIHGFNGLRQVLYEYLNAGGRIIAGTITWVLTLVFILGGGYSILMFVPDRAHIKQHPLKIEKTIEPLPGASTSLHISARIDVRC